VEPQQYTLSEKVSRRDPYRIIGEKVIGEKVVIPKTKEKTAAHRAFFHRHTSEPYKWLINTHQHIYKNVENPI
jgi:hypothetical protein